LFTHSAGTRRAAAVLIFLTFPRDAGLRG